MLATGHEFVRISNGGGHFVSTIRNPDRTFLTASLDRFGMNKIFFMAIFFIKRSMLANRTRRPVFGRFDIRMVGTGIMLQD